MKRIISIFLILPFTLLGVKTEDFTFNDYKTLSGGTFENVMLTHLGELMPAPALEKVGDLEAAKTVWDAVYDGTYLYVGTGNQGKVFRINAKGESELFFEPSQVLTRTLALGPDGALYVGTSPEGSVYRIVEGKRPEIYFDPEETYIWDMLFDREGNLYVSTGNAANIYKLPPDYQASEKLEPFYTSDRSHIHVMTLTEDGTLLAGASPKAYLLSINAEGQGDVIASGHGDEVSAIYKAQEAIYFATYTSEGQGNGAQGKPANQGSPSGGNAAPRPIYKLDDAGFVEPATDFPAGNVYTFSLPDDERSPWLVGSDANGLLFGLRDIDDWALLHQFEDGGQVSAIVNTDSDFTYVLTSHPAAVYRYGGQAQSSVYESDPLGVEQPARWGQLHRYISEGDEASLLWETRTGNTEEPDETWSSWSALEGATIQSPVGRFMQWRVTFAQASPAVVANTRAFYQYRNAAPIVRDIGILPFGTDINGNRGKQNAFPLQQLVSQENFKLNEEKEHKQLMINPDAYEMTAYWKARDPNGDDMLYELAIISASMVTDDPLIVLASDLRDPVFSFSTQGYQPGYYRLIVQAVDSPSNLPEQERKGRKVGQPFLIDNQAPALNVETLDKTANTRRVSIVATDGFSVITECSYVLNGKESIAVLPEDGLFDSLSERFVIELTDLIVGGGNSLIVTVKDQSGNEATWQGNF